MNPKPEYDFTTRLNQENQRLSFALDSTIVRHAPRIADAGPEEISRRLRQIIFLEYRRSLYHAELPYPKPTFRVSLHAGSDLKITAASEFSLHVDAGIAFKKVLRFFLIQAVAAFLVLRDCFRPKDPAQNLSLIRMPALRDYIPETKIMTEFHAFCFEGKFDFLKESDRVLTSHHRDQVSSDDRLVLTTNRLFFEALKHVPYSFMDVIRYFVFATRLSIEFVIQCLRFRPMSLLANDAAFWPLLRLLNKTGRLKNIVLNTSQIYDQEMWLHAEPGRSFSVRCIWYGMSTKELPIKGVSPIERPALTFFRADHNYVWNEHHRKDVASVMPHSGVIHVLGSNLWYNSNPKKTPRKRKRVVLFFSNPRTNEWMAGQFSWRLFYYGCFEIQERFYLDVIQGVRDYEKRCGEKIDVLVKLKRVKNVPPFDPRMDGLIATMEKDGCQIFDLNSEHSGNLYDEVFNSELTVCSPMSTPNFLAHELGKSGLYYDPTGKIDPPRDLADYKIGWATSPSELALFLDRVLGTALKPN